MDNKAIGVLGDPVPMRSVRDQQMQVEFGEGNMELYNGSGSIGVLGGLGQRTRHDIQMQKMFNPYYKEQQETFSFPYKVNGSGIAKLSDQPYNQYSGTVKRLPLR